MRGFLLDCYCDEKNNRLISWILQQERGRAVRIEHEFFPSFFVSSSANNLSQLFLLLQDLHEIKSINITEKKLCLGSEKTSRVLEITPKRLHDFRRLAKMIDCWGKHHRYRLFDVDLRMESRFLHSHNVFFNAALTVDLNGKMILDDSSWAIDYETPCWNTLTLDIEKPKRGTCNNIALTHFSINDETIDMGSEEDTLKELHSLISKKDPDIILTRGGDSFIFPYLYKRAAAVGLGKKFSLHRDKRYRKQKAVKAEKSYMSYGHIVYRPPFHTLKGRLHLDCSSSFFYREAGLFGLLDISRCSNLSLQLLSRLGPGTAISQMQMNHAQSQGFPIPWKKAQTETCKTALDLLWSDRGGHILSPRVGFFTDVVELDFASLYPNLMVKYNISPETMLCSCCGPNDALMVPQLGYHICSKKTGLLPSVLHPILTRRFCFKARLKHPDFDSTRYEALQKAWKWILVVCFGYTGYRNARFGRIECHEAITAYARAALLKAMHSAEQNGYQVLHGIVDSLWLQSKKEDSDAMFSAERVARLISQKVGVKMQVAGRYRWIVFLKSKGCDVGALTRYYGVFESGEIKARGIELRQRNTPLFFKEMQQTLLEMMAEAESASEIKTMLPFLFEYLSKQALRLKRNEVPLDELLITTSVSRHVSEYKVDNCVHAALLQAKKLGIIIHPGQSIRYIVCDEGCRDFMKRVTLQQTLEDGDDISIDFEFYLRWLVRCAESILLPFGFTSQKIFRKIFI